MGLFQKEVAAAVNVPVFLSSWLQVPFMYRMLQPGQKIGALVADSRYIRKQLLSNCGIDESIPLVIAGLEDRTKTPAFASGIRYAEGTLDTDAIEREVVSVASELVEANPGIGAILLECSCLPAYAAAVQEAVHVPVFDFASMINYAYSTLAPSRYEGTMHWSRPRPKQEEASPDSS
jgi:hypothetical protein